MKLLIFEKNLFYRILIVSLRNNFNVMNFLRGILILFNMENVMPFFKRSVTREDNIQNFKDTENLCKTNLNLKGQFQNQMKIKN